MNKAHQHHMRRALLLLILLAACDGVAPDLTPPQEARLALARWEGGELDERPVGTKPTDSGKAIFLGDLPGTESYHLQLTNEGSEPLRNVRISLAGNYEGIKIVPDRFAELLPESEAFAPSIFRVEIVHGDPRTPSIESGGPSDVLMDFFITPADSITSRDHLLQPQGELDIKLNVVAQRGSHGPWVSLEATLQVRVLVTDLVFLDNEREFDLARPDLFGSNGWFEMNDFIPHYKKVGPVRAVNTGNVPARLAYFARGLRKDYLLAPGDTLQILDAGNTGWVRIPPLNAILDYRKFPQYPNGYSYLYFMR